VSEENVETVRKYFELVNRRAFEELAARTPADFELDLSRSVGLDTRVYRGAEGRLMWERLTESWSDYEFFETEMIDAGDTIVRVGGLPGRGKGSGVEVVAEAASVWKFCDGLLASARLFQRRADALEAAGLSE
jgi:ketosteroid isomerase-like protein